MIQVCNTDSTIVLATTSRSNRLVQWLGFLAASALLAGIALVPATAQTYDIMANNPGGTLGIGSAGAVASTSLTRFENSGTGITLLVLVLVLGLGSLAGWLYGQERQDKAAGAAGAAMTRAIEQLEVGEGARARPVLDAMTRDGPGAYAGLARMVLANDALAGGDKAKARGLYETVANDPALPQPLRDAALVKAVRTGFDSLRPADVVAKLKPLAVPGNAWFGVAGELVAVAHIRAGQPEAARPILIALVKDEKASPSLRTRAAQLAIAAGVDLATGSLISMKR